jgi:hypothetical protein
MKMKRRARLLSFPLIQGTIGAVATGPVVTAVPSAHNIRYVPSSTVRLLTKRRAVDFLRVATAMCPRPVPFVA